MCDHGLFHIEADLRWIELTGARLTHLKKEEAAGRSCPADWTWIVPPMSSGITSVFHRYYDKRELVPNFFPGDTEGVCPVIH